MKDEIAVGRRSRGSGELQAQCSRQCLTRRIDVDERHLDAFDLRTEKPDQRPDDACADDRDASGRAWRRVPCGVQRCLNVGR